MARNTEIVRQWTVLCEIERSRAAGVLIDDLAVQCGVTTRTIRRDLRALEEAGFPLFDDRSRTDGRTRWHLHGHALKGLTAGLTLSELCALYFSRTLVTSLASSPFHGDLSSAFDKLTASLPSHLRQFLDKLPQVFSTKPASGAVPTDSSTTREPRLVARLLDATLHQREVNIVYHSRSSERTKTYRVHPYRLAHANGGLYLLAYVPEYGEVRTFAIARLEDLSPREEHFTPIEELPETAFPNSLGVHSGPAEVVEVAFDSAVSEYVRTHLWHPSQTVFDDPAGGLRVRLSVSVDHALRSWILSFGPLARVVAPSSLARDIARQLLQACNQYGDQPLTEPNLALPDESQQPDGREHLPEPEETSPSEHVRARGRDV